MVMVQTDFQQETMCSLTLVQALQASHLQLALMFWRFLNTCSAQHLQARVDLTSQKSTLVKVCFVSENMHLLIATKSLKLSCLAQSQIVLTQTMVQLKWLVMLLMKAHLHIAANCLNLSSQQLQTILQTARESQLANLHLRIAQHLKEFICLMPLEMKLMEQKQEMLMFLQLAKMHLIIVLH